MKLQVGDTPGVADRRSGAIGVRGRSGCACRCSSGRAGSGSRVRGRASGGPRLVEVGGLDRADARAGLTEDVDRAGSAELAGRGRAGRGESSEQAVNYEYYSSLALVTSVVVYLLAMFAHAAEWAAARTDRSTESRPATSWPVSVGARRPASSAASGRRRSSCRCADRPRPTPSAAGCGSSSSAGSASP